MLGDWPDVTTTLDSTQKDALKHILTKKLAVVQVFACDKMLSTLTFAT